MRTIHLIDVLWGDDPTGGPLNAPGNLKVHISMLRRRLRGQWHIVNWYGVGYAIFPWSHIPSAVAQDPLLLPAAAVSSAQ